MNETAAPRLSGGFVASVFLHGGLVALFVFAHTSTPPSAPPPYMVQLFKGGGEGTEAPAQPAPPPKAAAAPETKAAAVKPKPVRPKAKPKTAAKAAAEPGPPAKTETKEPPATGGPAGPGNAPVNISTPGVEFDYPFYINNIARAIISRFNAGNSTLVAEVRFVIQRTGVVDPNSIRIVTSSGNYSFDQRTLAAVEAAANAHAFQPLPPGFREDILPVTFRFSPSSYR